MAKLASHVHVHADIINSVNLLHQMKLMQLQEWWYTVKYLMHGSQIAVK